MDETLVQLRAFWDLTVEVWNTGVFGASVGDYIQAVLILLVFLVFRQLIAKIVLGTIRRMVRKTETRLDDRLLAMLQGPVKFLPLVLGWFFAINALPLNPLLASIGNNVTVSMIYFTIFWGLFNTVPVIAEALRRFNPKVFDGAILDWIGRALKGFVVLLGFASILETWDVPIAPIIGGLGLFGVAVALGAQDLFKNLIAGVLILSERRFRKGDWIKVDGVVEGTVENIGFRSTSVRQFNKALVQVPNMHLSDNALTNFTAMTYRRIYWHIGVTYATSKQQLEYIRSQIEAYVTRSEDFAKPHEASTFVRIDRFGASSIDIMVYCFTRTTAWGEWLAVKEKLAYRIKDIVEAEAGSSFAFPSQSLYLESLPDPAAQGDKPELYLPPGFTDMTGSPSGPDTGPEGPAGAGGQQLLDLPGESVEETAPQTGKPKKGRGRRGLLGGLLGSRGK